MFLNFCVSQVIVHSFGDCENLDGVAFMDVNIYVTSISVIKNYILIGDAYKSVIFCVFQEDPPKLIHLGKDFGSMKVVSTQMIPYKDTLGLVVADEYGNLHSYSYSPLSPLSMSGMKLLHKSDFHVGSLPIALMVRASLDVATTISGINSNTYSNSDGVFPHSLLVYSTSDGQVGKIVPISEKMYKRMNALTMSLMASRATACGLNPREHRIVKCPERRHIQPSKNVVDLSFIIRSLAMMTRDDRDTVAKSAGWKSFSLLMGDLEQMQVDIL